MIIDNLAVNLKYHNFVEANIRTMKLSEIHLNPKNPRFIRDDRFQKLVQSIKEFPKMMSLRPIIVDSQGMILGGNMRYRALKELGYNEVPDEWIKRDGEMYLYLFTLTEEEKRRFVIVDNLPFGEYNFDILANEWDEKELDGWGLDIPNFEPSSKGMKEEEEFECPKCGYKWKE
jgi:ParB-like chromosome segregation protein Spo0J